MILLIKEELLVNLEHVSEVDFNKYVYDPISLEMKILMFITV